jgi:tRNA 5-methylaminomethyl-2-thiouridine biosynthesis bifunctional protein
MGRVKDDVWMLGGLGARGFTLAPLLGDMLAAAILGRAMPLARDQMAGIDVVRYLQT